MFEPWVWLALVSGLLSNTSNFLLRVLLKDDPDPALYTWFLETYRLVVAGILVFFNFHLVATLHSVILLLALGIVEAISIYIYMKQHSLNTLSSSTIISRTRLIWTALLAFLLLGEHISLAAYIGIVVLFVGLSVGTSPRKIVRDNGARYAYLSAGLVSVTNVMVKAISPFASVPVMIVAMAIPTVVAYPIILKNSYRRMRQFLSVKLGSKLLAMTANVAALFLALWALQTGPVSIVNAIYQGTMVFAILAGVIFLNERQDVGRKLVGSTIAVVGVWLLCF